MIELPQDVPPSVLSAAEILVRSIEASGVMAPADAPTLEARAKAAAFLVISMYDPEVEVEVRKSDPASHD